MDSADVEIHCSHKNKTSLINANEVRKKLKNCKNLKCGYCDAPTIWSCMACGKLGCEKEQHMEKHCTSNEMTGATPHFLAFNLENFDVWCFRCKIKLENNEWLGQADNIKKFLDNIRSFQKLTAPKSSTTKKSDDVKIEKAKIEKKSSIKTKLNSNVCVKGLPNLGNTCFFNSVLQCIMHTPHLAYFSEKIGKDEKIEIKSTTVIIHGDKRIDIPDAEIRLASAKFVLTKCLNNFLADFRSLQDPNPRTLFHQISLAGYNQQDAHELLRYLLDGIRKEEQERWKQGIAAYLGLSSVDTNSKKNDQEQTFLAEGFFEAAGRPLIDSIFGGSLLQSIRCLKCNHLSNRLEPFLDLSLSFTGGVDGAQKNINAANAKKKPGVIATKHQQKKLRKQQKKQPRNKRIVSTEKSSEIDDEINDEENGISESDETPLISETDAKNSELENVFNDKENDKDEIDALANDLSYLMNGHVQSINYAEFLDPIPIEVDNDNSLYRCLNDFVSEESLTGSNAYECKKCCKMLKNKSSNGEQRVEALKRYVIFAPPTILTIHFKRFEQAHTTFTRSTLKKIRGHVQFPLKLDLASFCSKHNNRIFPNQTQIWYSLYGVVSHSGDLNNGHYVAYVRRRPTMPHQNIFIEMSTQIDQLNNNNNEKANSFMNSTELKEHAESYLNDVKDSSQWYLVSDASVSPVTLARVLATEAYILFYERVL